MKGCTAVLMRIIPKSKEKTTCVLERESLSLLQAKHCTVRERSQSTWSSHAMMDTASDNLG